jgi:cytochrome c553
MRTARLVTAVMFAACAAPVSRAQAPSPPAVVATKCALCHGETGESADEMFPRLAAQHEAYLAKELRDFKSGRRAGVMVRMARGLSEEDIVAIAKYFAAQPARAASGAPSEIAAVGRFIHLRGNPYSGVPPCKTCHGEAAHGTPQLPRLAGQNAAYLERQIREFGNRARTNDNEVMHAVAATLTPLETRAVAEYLSALP